MIQVVLMERKDWIIKHKDFGDDETAKVAEYIRLALRDNKATTINITTWNAITGERL